MKKLLIASAALAMVAGTAQAQSSVTVYGVLDIGYTAAENKATTSAGVTTTSKATSTGNGDGGLATSRLGFRGTEDLGGGTKANFVLEYDLIDVGAGGNGQVNAAVSTSNGATAAPNSGSALTRTGFGARYSWVGLEDAKLGQLRLGRQEQSIHSVVVGGSAGMANNVTGAIYSAGEADISTNSATVRPHLVFLNRAVTYISPSFNGLRVEAQTSSQKLDNGLNQGDTSAKEMGGSLKYAAGKFAAAYGFATTKLDVTNSTSTDAKFKQEAINASYDFGVAKVFALHTKRKDTNLTTGALASDTKGTEVGVQVPMGKTLLWASAYEGDRNGSRADAAYTAAPTAANLGVTPSDIKGYQVGAMYNLSKRTAVYGIYGTQEIKATGALASGAKIESPAVAAGVRHSF